MVVSVILASISFCLYSTSLLANGYGSLVEAPVLFTHSDFGGVGLLQVPSARMAPDGSFNVNFSHVSPYNRTSISAQVLPWLEGTVRYTAITNRKYGSEEFSGDQTYKDRGFDIKISLMNEVRYLPEVSLALHDFAGTGLFSSEFLVGSKRYFDWDFTLGLAWGNGGAGGGIRNPFSVLSSKFDVRDSDSGEGGDVTFGNYFSGEEVALIGGVEYSPLGVDWSFKVELDGNDYAHEGLGNRLSQASPINFGVVYRLSDLFRLQFGLERGDTLMAGIQMGMNFGSEYALMPKFDIPPKKINPNFNDRRGLVDAVNKEGGRIQKILKEEGVVIDAIEATDSQLTVYARQNRFRDQARAVSRATRSLINQLPITLSSVRYINREKTLNTNEVLVYVEPFKRAVEDKIQAGYVEPYMMMDEAPIEISEDATLLANYPAFNWRIRPVLSPSFGAPESFVIYKLWLKLASEVQVTERLSINNVFSINIHNNYDELDQPSDSLLPHVRSDVKEYAKEGDNSIQRMQMDYIWKVYESTYSRFSAGIFESMYGGVGAEFLYKPIKNRLGVGLDVNYVKQRDFDQLFDFRSYNVATGHLTMYYDTPIKNTSVKLSVGRYLAKDIGGTIDLSRHFKSGVVLGGWATFTDVSSEEFGEGSFDKGIYIKFPLDLFFVESRKDSLMASWRPLTRDGGQKLSVGNQLYGLVNR